MILSVFNLSLIGSETTTGTGTGAGTGATTVFGTNGFGTKGLTSSLKIVY